MKILKLLMFFHEFIVVYKVRATKKDEGSGNQINSLFKEIFKVLFLQGAFHLLVEPKVATFKSYSSFYDVRADLLSSEINTFDINLETPDIFFFRLEVLEDKYRFLKTLSYLKKRIKEFDRIRNQYNLKDLLVEPTVYLGFEIVVSDLYREAFQLYSFVTCLETLIFSEAYQIYKKNEVFRKSLKTAIESLLKKNLKAVSQVLSNEHQKTPYESFDKDKPLRRADSPLKIELDLKNFFIYSLAEKLENKILSNEERVVVSSKKLEALMKNIYKASILEKKETIYLFKKFKKKLASEISILTRFIEEERREGDFVFIRNDVVLLMEAMRDLFPLLKEPVNDLNNLWSIDESRDEEDFKQAKEIEGVLKMKDLLFKFYCYNKMGVDNLLLGFIDRRLLKLSVAQRQKVLAFFKRIVLFLLKMFPYKLVALLLGVFLTDGLARSWLEIFNSWKLRFDI